MRGLRLRALFVGMAALPACSLVVDLDGLSSGTESNGDAGNDVSFIADAARDGAAAEASTIDASTPDDPCTSAHPLCENFDEDGGVLNPIWTPQNDEAVIDIAQDASVSPPASLRISPKKSGDFAAIYDTISMTPFPKGIKCGFAMQIDNYPAGSSAQFLDIQITTGDPSISSYDLNAYGANQDVASIEESASYVDGGESSNDKDVPFQVFDGKWHELTVIATLSGTPTLELDVDGTLAAIEPITPPPNLAAAVFSVGFDADDSAGPVWTTRFDNLVCDWIN